MIYGVELTGMSIWEESFDVEGRWAGYFADSAKILDDGVRHVLSA